MRCIICGTEYETPFDHRDSDTEYELYRHPKIDEPIRDTLAAYGVTGDHAAQCSWYIQHRLHCQGITMSLHGEPVQ